jgi:hypothetical protein
MILRAEEPGGRSALGSSSLKDVGVRFRRVAAQYFSLPTLSAKPASGIVGFHPAVMAGAED